MQKEKLLLGLDSLVIFRNILEDEPIKKLRLLLETDISKTDRLVFAYSDFAAALLKKNDSLGGYLASFITEDENLYVQSILSGKKRDILDNILENELQFLNSLSEFDGSEIKQAVGEGITLPSWKSERYDLAKIYHSHIGRIPVNGFGIFAKYNVFLMNDDGSLSPVKNPDGQRLSELYGYEAQREKIIANTKALLDGEQANNALLYGDAGTGKSSTVKAVANEFACKGLRLIELAKKQLYRLPELLDTLAENPLKFIIFIDDLCFDSDDRDFSAFKAILEGGVGCRRQNTVIYATSNHRHMVKERTSDRAGEEVNINDTLQELSSLSARFGLTLTFDRPNKKLFEDIVLNLAEKYCSVYDENEITVKAEAFAIRSGGRNARVAKQFIELYNAGILK